MKKSMSMQELRELQGRDAPEPSTVPPDPIEPVELESFKDQDKPADDKPDELKAQLAQFESQTVRATQTLPDGASKTGEGEDE